MSDKVSEKAAELPVMVEMDGKEFNLVNENDLNSLALSLNERTDAQSIINGLSVREELKNKIIDKINEIRGATNSKSTEFMQVEDLFVEAKLSAEQAKELAAYTPESGNLLTLALKLDPDAAAGKPNAAKLRIMGDELTRRFDEIPEAEVSRIVEGRVEAIQWYAQLIYSLLDKIQFPVGLEGEYLTQFNQAINFVLGRGDDALFQKSDIELAKAKLTKIYRQLIDLHKPWGLALLNKRQAAPQTIANAKVLFSSKIHPTPKELVHGPGTSPVAA